MSFIKLGAGSGHGGVCGPSDPTPPASCSQGPMAEPPLCPQSFLPDNILQSLSSSPQASLMKVPEDAWTPVVPTHYPAPCIPVWAAITLEIHARDAICSFVLPC